MGWGVLKRSFQGGFFFNRSECFIKNTERKHVIPKPLYPDHLLRGGQNPCTVLNMRSRKCLLFQVCIIQDGSVKARCIYTLRLLTIKWSWPNLVSLSMGFSCQGCWIGWRYDTHFSSTNSMPAGLSHWMMFVNYVRLAHLLFCWQWHTF